MVRRCLTDTSVATVDLVRANASYVGIPCEQLHEVDGVLSDLARIHDEEVGPSPHPHPTSHPPTLTSRGSTTRRWTLLPTLTRTLRWPLTSRG